MILKEMPKFLSSPHYHSNGKRQWIDDEAPEEVKKEFEEFQAQMERLRKQGIIC